jgi:hypothetical protein
MQWTGPSRPGRGVRNPARSGATADLDAPGPRCRDRQAKQAKVKEERALMSQAQRKKTTKIPQLARLKYGPVYCELCRRDIDPGEPVAWWRVPASRGARRTAYCSDCHHANVRHGGPIR